MNADSADGWGKIVDSIRTRTLTEIANNYLRSSACICGFCSEKLQRAPNPMLPRPTVTAKIEFGVGMALSNKGHRPHGPNALRQACAARAVAQWNHDRRSPRKTSRSRALTCRARGLRSLLSADGARVRRRGSLPCRYGRCIAGAARTEIRERFAAAIKRLAEIGLLEKCGTMTSGRTRITNRRGPSTFARIACPFLEDESCSIHPQRPVSCREFLVTSPAENCFAAVREGCSTDQFPFKMWWALRFDPLPADARYVPWVPLIRNQMGRKSSGQGGALPGPELVSRLSAS